MRWASRACLTWGNYWATLPAASVCKPRRTPCVAQAARIAAHRRSSKPVSALAPVSSSMSMMCTPFRAAQTIASSSRRRRPTSTPIRSCNAIFASLVDRRLEALARFEEIAVFAVACRVLRAGKEQPLAARRAVLGEILEKAEGDLLIGRVVADPQGDAGGPSDGR